MTAKPSSNPPRDFLFVARQLSLLDDEAARSLEAEGRATHVSPAHLALRHGLLDAVQIDVVETLMSPDDVVPGYEILDLIGQGGMGVVFRARQKSLDRIVAIKTILVSQMHDPTALTRFQQEALAVAKLRHPNIVAAYDLGRHQGRLYFVMELIEGEDVEQKIDAEGVLDEATAWGFVRQAASGLSHAAAAGIVHRDIKPANLLLVEPPAGFELPGGLKMVKIADFGLAFLARDVETKTRLTSATATIGSPHYIAPEQLDGDVFDHRIDIYSLGASAYHMLAGEPPFNSKKLSQIVAQKLATDAIDIRSRHPHVSLASADLVRRMTQRDPAKRIASYPELIAEIEQLRFGSGGISVSADPTNHRGPTVRIAADRTPTPAANSEFAKTALYRRWPGRALLWSGIAVVALVAVVSFVLFHWAGSAGSNRSFDRVGREANLFNGKDLSGWQPLVGQWETGTNDEGGSVIKGGSDGVIRHGLAFAAGERPPEFFRLTTVINLRDADAAEIEFGIAAQGDDGGTRSVVQVSREGVSWGRRESGQAAYQRVSEIVPIPRDSERPPEIAIERQPDAWRIVYRNAPVGTLPADALQTLPEIRFRVAGGEAWFSDVLIQEFRPPAEAETTP